MVYIIGHRGAMGYEPENTIRSFRKAVELRADAIELDVMLCKSGELVVIHDDTVDRTTDGKGNVSDLTLSQLKEFDAGKGERIPTLNEVLDAVSLPINIELKGPGTAESLYKILKSRDDRFSISSFDRDELIAYRKLDSSRRVGLLADGLPNDYLTFASYIKASSINPDYHFTSKDLVKSAHALNIFVYPWTVNKPEDMKKALSMNIDGMFTNYPDLARGL